MKYDYITDPKVEFKALALAYVQGQDLSGKTPEEVLDMYDDALSRIYTRFEESD